MTDPRVKTSLPTALWRRRLLGPHAPSLASPIAVAILLWVGFCVMMWVALTATEQWLMFGLGFQWATVLIGGCSALGVAGAIGGGCSAITLYLVRARSGRG